MLSATATTEETAVRLRLAIMRAARRLRQESQGGLGPASGAALATIAVHGPLTPSQVAEHEKVKRPTVTRIIAGLEEAGLVVREADPDDGRSCRVRTTEAGDERLADARARQAAQVAGWLEDLDDADRDTLARAAEILSAIAARDRDHG
ncbi:MAG: MarR family winged helix-turn-helix transcriptional regulator [Solirubrobacteraceae bacterium]